MPQSWNAASQWLINQAASVYCWNNELLYWQVKTRWHYAGGPAYLPVPVSERLCQSFNHQDVWHHNKPNLKDNLMFRLWPELSHQMKRKVASFFEENNLTDFDFFDHGGRAMVFLSTDKTNGRQRIARMEANHSFRSIRPENPTVLQPFVTNEGDVDSYDGIKLEIMPEIVPLNKLPARSHYPSGFSLARDFHVAVFHLSFGTNLTYGDEIFDADSEPQNVGVLPDGKIVSHDPEFRFGVQARELQTHFRKQKESVSLAPYAQDLYGMASGAHYF